MIIFLTSRKKNLSGFFLQVNLIMSSEQQLNVAKEPLEDDKCSTQGQGDAPSSEDKTEEPTLDDKNKAKPDGDENSDEDLQLKWDDDDEEIEEDIISIHPPEYMLNYQETSEPANTVPGDEVINKEPVDDNDIIDITDLCSPASDAKSEDHNTEAETDSCDSKPVKNDTNDNSDTPKDVTTSKIDSNTDMIVIDDDNDDILVEPKEKNEEKQIIEKEIDAIEEKMDFDGLNDFKDIAMSSNVSMNESNVESIEHGLNKPDIMLEIPTQEIIEFMDDTEVSFDLNQDLSKTCESQHTDTPETSNTKETNICEVDGDIISIDDKSQDIDNAVSTEEALKPDNVKASNKDIEHEVNIQLNDSEPESKDNKVQSSAIDIEQTVIKLNDSETSKEETLTFKNNFNQKESEDLMEKPVDKPVDPSLDSLKDTGDKSLSTAPPGDSNSAVSTDDSKTSDTVVDNLPDIILATNDADKLVKNESQLETENDKSQSQASITKDKESVESENDKKESIAVDDKTKSDEENNSLHSENTISKTPEDDCKPLASANDKLESESDKKVTESNDNQKPLLSEVKGHITDDIKQSILEGEPSISKTPPDMSSTVGLKVLASTDDAEVPSTSKIHEQLAPDSKDEVNI
jgi:hypothetical protein